MFAIVLNLIVELMVTSLDDRMVNTRIGRGDPEPTHPNGNPPPPLTMAQAIAAILESRNEQTELLWRLVANSTPTTYGDFAATHTPLFTEVGEPLEADHWLRVIKSKFRLLRCTKLQKTLFAAQQLCGNTSAW
jgi:hypothetical protein